MSICTGWTINEFPAFANTQTLSATPTERPYNNQLTDKNLNNPPHIAAHLQAAQSQHTDPSSQKSCNLANAPKPTHHPDIDEKFRQKPY